MRALTICLLLAVLAATVAAERHSIKLSSAENPHALYFIRYDLEHSATKLFVIPQPHVNGQQQFVRDISGTVSRFVVDMKTKMLFYVLTTMPGTIFRTELVPNSPSIQVAAGGAGAVIGGLRLYNHPQAWLFYMQVDSGQQSIHAIDAPSVGMPRSYVLFNDSDAERVSQIADMDVHFVPNREDPAGPLVLVFSTMLVNAAGQTAVQIQEVEFENNKFNVEIQATTVVVTNNATRMWGLASGLPQREGIYALMETTECGNQHGQTQECLRRVVVRGETITLDPNPSDAVVTEPSSVVSGPRIAMDTDFEYSTLYYVRKGVLTVGTVRPPSWSKLSYSTLAQDFGDVVSFYVASARI